MTVSLRLDDIHVTLGGNKILHGVSMDIKAGEFVTLLGPSGSGKSTTLNAVAGLAQPDSGAVLFDGEDVTRVPPHSRDIAVVFQSYALFPHMTVAENVAFPLLTQGRPKRERLATAERMLELVRLPGMGGRRPAQLSGGQQQRVALARALAAEPRVLLLDEPMAALDRGLRESMQVEIKRLQSSLGITTVAVTHDQTEALTMSDRVAIMRDGRIEQFGTPEELYQRPASEFIATFLGEANLVRVTDGKLAGFGVPVSGTGTAVLRPEDLRIAEHDGSGPALEGVLRLKVFQGARFRLEVEHSELGTLVVSLPGDADVSGLSHGSAVRLSCGQGGGRVPHVIGA
ncbi:ABC transporter ATP-binding protein [Streptomyces sp. NPDC002896]|uniref:ABC transporter ATP-binding protein n=1 Tax=Streptomyces sp. NPDC002896 TaxID=3154438 RepID=UPI003324F097